MIVKKIPVMVLFLGILPLFLPAQTVKLDVPFYEQGNNSPWADELLGNKSLITIRTHGCALTCISMITSFFSNADYNPSHMNQWLKENNGFEDEWEGGSYWGEVMLNWPALGLFEGGYTYTRHEWKVQPADVVLIRYYLDRGIPLIAEVTYKKAPHYVVLTGYKGSDFFMNDPEFPNEPLFGSIYNISDKWGSGPSRNINGIRVLYPPLKN